MITTVFDNKNILVLSVFLILIGVSLSIQIFLLFYSKKDQRNFHDKRHSDLYLYLYELLMDYSNVKDISLNRLLDYPIEEIFIWALNNSNDVNHFSPHPFVSRYGWKTTHESLAGDDKTFDTIKTKGAA